MEIITQLPCPPPHSPLCSIRIFFSWESKNMERMLDKKNSHSCIPRDEGIDLSRLCKQTHPCCVLRPLSKVPCRCFYRWLIPIHTALWIHIVEINLFLISRCLLARCLPGSWSMSSWMVASSDAIFFIQESDDRNAAFRDSWSTLSGLSADSRVP
jgi:hypothetical protein